jgi:hypothetical protein
MNYRHTLSKKVGGGGGRVEEMGREEGSQKKERNFHKYINRTFLVEKLAKQMGKST